MIKFFIHQLIHKWIILKAIVRFYIKIDIKTAPTRFGAITIIRVRIISSLLKLLLLK
jgi:hypothetical protein